MTQEELAKMFGINLESNDETFTVTRKNDNRKQNNFRDNRGGNRKNNSPQNKSVNNPKKTTSTFAPTDNATAPYNFVGLPDKPLSSEISSLEDFKAHIQRNCKLSGEIVLDIETKTPLFIGGNPCDETVTFSPTGTPIIAGSTLRGMFKNILKIVTCGTFRGRTDSQRKGEDFNDEHIYFRCLMASSGCPKWMVDLNKLYKDRFKDDDGKTSTAKNARPGFLVKTSENEYFIIPAKVKDENGRIFTLKSDRPNEYELMKNFQSTYGKVKFRDSCIEWDGARAYCLTGNQFEKSPEKLLNAAQYKKYKEDLAALHAKWKAGDLTDKEHQKAVSDLGQGKQIVRYTLLDYVDWEEANWIKLPDDVRLSYEHDRNRKGVDLIKLLDEGKSSKSNRRGLRNGALSQKELETLTKKNLPHIKALIPCHFLTEKVKNSDEETITAFGHGQCFRLPYEKTIGDNVPDDLNDKEFKVIDFSDAIFGCGKHWASRVYFEDAVPIPSSTVRYLDKDGSHPLMQPNPTSYQLYLKQNLQQTDGILNHWDKLNAQIRGYKLYWHNKKWDWQADDNEKEEDKKRLADKKEPLIKKITPLAKDNKFTAKIRFKNLSEVELGALMMIFDLNGAKNPAYKIGQGKPFGFGSIKVTPTLYLEREDAYENIFSADGWNNPYAEVDAKVYLDAFKNYVYDPKKKISATWEKVMEELNAILNWDQVEQKGWSDKIKPIPSDFKDKKNLFLTRAVLPSILDVVK